MNATIHEPDSAQPWPPREGWKFLLLWVAGLLVFAVFHRLADFIGHVARIDASQSDPTSILAPALHAWQAWLLFSSPARRICWIIIPVVWLRAHALLHPGHNIAYADYNLALIHVPGVVFLRLLDVIVPIAEMALLVGIRRRPWAWLFAGIGQAILATHDSGLMRLIDVSKGFGGPSEWHPRIPGWIADSQSTTLWLAGEIGVAFLLAFWMQPLVRERREAPPLPPPVSEPTPAKWRFLLPSPCTGMPLFWRWMICDAAFAIFAILQTVGFAAGPVCTIAVAIVASWQAGLLFRPGWRFAAWVSLLLLSIPCSLLAVRRSLFFDIKGEVFPWWLLTLLLIHVRRCPWVLAVATLVPLATDWFNFEVFGDRPFTVLKAVSAKLSGMLPPATTFNMAWGVFVAGYVTTWWLLFHRAAVVAALAFCMPPIVREHGQAPLISPVPSPR